MTETAYIVQDDLKIEGVDIRFRGEGNIIVADFSEIASKGLLIEFYGNSNIVRLGVGGKSNRSRFVFQGDRNEISLGSTFSLDGCRFQANGNDARIDVGPRFSANNNTKILVKEDGCSVSIGADCLFSTDISIRTSDNHGIFERGTKERINPGRNVIIGDRVWIGEDAKILKGANIEHDVVVGAASIVTGNIPSFSAVAGVPARVVRPNIYWYKHLALPEGYDHEALVLKSERETAKAISEPDAKLEP